MARHGVGSDYPCLVLVYGSLKRGCSNHHWLAGAHDLGEAELPGLALHDLGPFPMAVASPGAAPLRGELYGVSDSQLALLDQLEGVPRLYRRERRQLASGDPVWVYVGRKRQVRHAPLLERGGWEGPRQGNRGRREPLPKPEP